MDPSKMHNINDIYTRLESKKGLEKYQFVIDVDYKWRLKYLAYSKGLKA